MKKGIRKKIEWNLYTYDKHLLDKVKETEIAAFTDFLTDWLFKNKIKIVIAEDHIRADIAADASKYAYAIWYKYILKESENPENDFFLSQWTGIEDYRHHVAVGLSDLAIHCAYLHIIYP